MEKAQEVVLVDGFGLMQIPAGLSDKDAYSYISQQLSKPKELPPVEEKPKPSPGIMSQLGAGAVGTLEGFGSSIGSMIKGLSYVDPANIGYKYLTGDKVGPTEKIADFVSDGSKYLSAKILGDELYNSGGAQAGRFTGTLASYFTPGLGAKVLGAGAKAALAASTLASAAGGAGEQSQSIREAREKGKDISTLEEYGAVGLAGLGTALAERIPMARFLDSGIAAPFLKKIPGIGKLLDSAIPVETVKQIEKKFAGDGAKIAEALALAGVQASATRSIKDIAIDAAKSGLLEAPVEGLQNTLQKAITKTYDPETDLTEGLMESMVGGAVAGTALKGGIGLAESIRNRKIISQNQAEAQRNRGPAPLIPDVLPQDTLVSSNKEQRFVGRESAEAKAERLRQEAEAEQLKKEVEAERLRQESEAASLVQGPSPGGIITPPSTTVNQTSTGSDQNIEAPAPIINETGNEVVIPSSDDVKESEDPKSVVTSSQGNLDQANQLGVDAGLPNDYLDTPASTINPKYKQEYNKAERAIASYPDIGNNVLSSFGYKSVESIPIGEVSSFVNEVYDTVARSSVPLRPTPSPISQQIEPSSQIVDGINVDEKENNYWKHELAEGAISTYPDIGEAILSRLGHNSVKDMSANEAYDFGKEVYDTSVDRFYGKKRAAVALFGDSFYKLSKPQQLAAEIAAKNGEDAAVVVTQEETDEFNQFKDKPFFAETYSYVQDKLKESPDISITATRLRNEFNLSAPEAGSMISLMRQRGDVASKKGKIFIEPDAKGPMFELNETQPTPEPQVAQTQSQPQPQAVKPEPIDPAQFEFNETIARQYAPDLVAALKERKMDDVLLLGIAGSIRDAKGDVQPRRGQYLDRLITISVAPDGKVRSTKDMIKTLDHEIIHAMRELKMFSDNEWNMLTQKFQVSYLGDREKQYRELYKGKSNLVPLLREEAVAKAAADFFDVDPKRLDPVSRSLVGKVKSILGFGRTAAQMGYSSAEDVLAAIKSGEVGSRAYTPAFEVTTQGKEVSNQRPIFIGAPKKIETLITPNAPSPSTATAAPAVVDPNAKATSNKGKNKGKGKGKDKNAPPSGASDLMTGPEDGVSKVDGEDEGEESTTDNPSRVFTPAAKKGLLKSIADVFSYDTKSSFRQKFVDQHDPIKLQAIQAYEETGDRSYISAGAGAYHAISFAGKSQDIAMAGLQNGGYSTTASGRVIANDDPDSSLLKMWADLAAMPSDQPGYDNKLDEWFEVGAARRFMALKKAGRDPGGVVSEEQMQKTLDTFAGDSVINEALAKYRSFNDSAIDVLVDSKFISKEMGETWKSGAYFPMYRMPTVMSADGSNVETGEIDAPRVGTKSANLAAIKSLTGRKLRVNDGLENIIYNTNNMIGTAMKSHAAHKIVRDGLITKNMKQIAAPKDAEYGTNVININNNGVKEYYQVNDSMLYDAVAKSAVPLQDILLLMGKFTQMLTKGVTSSPPYIFRNSVRDVLDVWSRGGIGSDLIPPMGEYINGIVSVAQNSPEYRALKQAGVASSGIREQSIEKTAKAIREKIGVGQDDAMSKLWGLMSKPFKKSADFAEASEGVSRTQVYKSVLERTGDVDEAVFAAMETINFSRRGNSRGAQIAMALIPFFNARIQGIDVFYRSGGIPFLKADKISESSMGPDATKTARRRMAYVAGLSALYTVAMATNKAWLNANDEERRNNIFIPIDWISGIKEGTVLKFPIPQESGIITKMLPETLMSYYLGQTDGPAMVSAMKSVVFGNLNFLPLPQMVKPIIEDLANKDFYTQRPIENLSMQRINPEQRYTEYTPEAYKLAGKTFGVSPIKLEHLVRGYFGTNGAMVADIVSMLIPTGSGKESPDRLRFSEPYLLPVVGQMFKSPNGSRAVESLYMLDNAASMASNTLRLVSKGQRELSDEKKQEYRTMSNIDRRLRPILAQVDALNKSKRAVLASTMTSSEKRDELNRIQERIIAAADRAKDLKKLVP